MRLKTEPINAIVLTEVPIVAARRLAVALARMAGQHGVSDPVYAI